MELRAAAFISGDRAMTEAFEQGLDLHRITAARMSGKDPEAVTGEERRGAKAVNFGGIYGQGAAGLVQSAWAQWGLVLDQAEATAWLQAFEDSYLGFAQWRREHYRRCEERRMHCDRQGRRSRNRQALSQEPRPRGRVVLHPLLQSAGAGSCADASMLALAYVDDRLFAAGIDGGPVAWLHDEIVIEVRGSGRATQPDPQAGDDRRLRRDISWRAAQWAGRSAHRLELGRG